MKYIKSSIILVIWIIVTYDSSIELVYKTCALVICTKKSYIIIYMYNEKYTFHLIFIDYYHIHYLFCKFNMYIILNLILIIYLILIF